MRLEDPGQIEVVQKRIQAALPSTGSAKVQDWIATVGPLAEVVMNLKLIFNGLIFVIGLVALLIITNSLVISISERIPEIGTIRALGAQRGFVRTLVTTETVLTAIVFGSLGIGLAVVTLVIASAVGVRAPNELIAVLVGGSVLRPAVTAAALVQSFLLVVAVGFLASLYPVVLALRVSPIRAMQSH